MKISNNRRLWRRIGGALTGVVILVGAAVLPVDWQRLGCTLSLAAAGLRQPANTAVLLEKRLQQVETPRGHLPTAPQSSTVSPDAALPQTKPDISADATGAVETLAALSISPPGEKGNGGKIITETLDVGKTGAFGVAVLNRSGTAVDIAAALKRPLSQTWQHTDQPQVLIVHTHTTEQFMLYDAGYYNDGDRDRTRDRRQNICAVGRAVAAELEAAGVTVIQDTTVHDSPQYTGAYARSAATVEAYLKKYPSIQVVLDIHRDAILRSTTTLVKPTVEIDGQKAAQMMIIAGVVSTETLPHPDWEKNLTLAARWQQALHKTYPGLMRPLYTVASRYNQHLSPGYLLVEVGSEANTVGEVTYSGRLLGKTLAKLLA